MAHFDFIPDDIGSSSKLEWEPIFPAGFYDRSPAETRAICVDAFPGSVKRPGIMNGLEALVTELDGLGITCEVWVDGSFLTKKLEPGDADVVVNVYEADHLKFTPDQKQVLRNINGPLKDMLYRKYHLDVYAIVEHGAYPEGHLKFGLGEWQRAYWIRQFGQDRGHNKDRESRYKGMIRIRVPLAPKP